ncbi:hypothetical protein H920_04765 [Fukomys damarensis]|uniref:Uncharacterized protein n=1 Tax=Fukomys damarensis TaxID=885580 RepID=A0A091EEJ2_FUKDA|nr:hypothetical protein H920_04765 [Fukomys damarensis]
MAQLGQQQETLRLSAWKKHQTDAGHPRKEMDLRMERHRQSSSGKTSKLRKGFLEDAALKQSVEVAATQGDTRLCEHTGCKLPSPWPAEKKPPAALVVPREPVSAVTLRPCISSLRQLWVTGPLPTSYSFPVQDVRRESEHQEGVLGFVQLFKGPVQKTQLHADDV